MTLTPLETVGCLMCGRPTGVPQLDPWRVPAGCVASVVVTCARCRAEKEPQWMPMPNTFASTNPIEGTRHEAEADEQCVSTVMVWRLRGAYAMVAIDRGEVVASVHGWSTRGAAYDAGWRALLGEHVEGRPAR